jgi:hypothetical protein
VTTLAILGAVLLLAVGAAVAWYQDSRIPLVIAAVLAVAGVAGALLVFDPTRAARAGVTISLDGSCDRAPFTPAAAGAVRAALASGIDGGEAAALTWFGANARTSRNVILDLTDAPPAGVRGDAVEWVNWKHARALAAADALERVRLAACRRVGTSIVGAAEAANDMLADAGVDGGRRIFLVTNLVEYSSALRIKENWFGPDNVPAAVRAIAQLPAMLRRPLGPDVTVEVLFTPVVRRGQALVPLAENTAVALEMWARRVFGQVLRAGKVTIRVLPTEGARS